MYAGIDIGGSKTLVASLDCNGVITQKIRFETPKNYDDFLSQLKDSVGRLKTREFTAGGVGTPGVMDKSRERVLWFGNLPWENISLQHDMEKILHCPVVVENDAKMAALSEAMMLKDEFQKVLYVTISTGIGLGLVDHQVIDTELGDAGGHSILIEHGGKLVPWESFASGRAIVERYGKKAQDIKDKATWHKIARDLCVGLIELIALMEPEVIVFGGSIGTYFDRFAAPLQSELNKYSTPLVSLPVLRGAARPEEAVLYGCYDLAKARFAYAEGII